MLRKHMLHLLAAITALFAADFTMGKVVAQINSIPESNMTIESKTSGCASLPSRYSLRSEVIPGTGIGLPYTEDGPAGIDGGLIDLLSNYRMCSGH